MGGIFINKKLFFIGKKSSPHHPITPSPHPPRQFLTENETALIPSEGDTGSSLEETLMVPALNSKGWIILLHK
jgi:hypothetical protein